MGISGREVHEIPEKVGSGTYYLASKVYSWIKEIVTSFVWRGLSIYARGRRQDIKILPLTHHVKR